MRWLQKLLKTPAGKSSRRNKRVFPQAAEFLENRLLLTLLGSESHVNTVTAGNQFDVAVSAAPDGRSIAVWVHRISSTDTDIQAQRFDRNGIKVGSEFNVARNLSNESEPDVAMNNNGSFVVVWTDQVSSSNQNVIAQRFNSNGATVGSRIIVAGTAKNEYDASIASAPSGDFVVSFTLDFSSTDQDIMAARYSNGGTLLGTVSVSTSTSDDEVNSSVARASNGRFAIAYQTNVSGGSNSDIFLKRYSSTGTLVDTKTIANGINDQERPSVSVDNSFNAVVVWQEFISSDLDVKARTVSSAGTLGTTIIISGVGGGVDEQFADVSYRRSGGMFVVSYTSRNSTTTSVNIKEVRTSGTIQHSATAAASSRDSSIAFGNGSFYGLAYTGISRSSDPGLGIFGRLGQV